jgi:hypothetical protein
MKSMAIVDPRQHKTMTAIKTRNDAFFRPAGYSK